MPFEILIEFLISPADSSVNQLTKFKEAAEKGNLVPLYRCVFSDHLTPILAYRCLVKEDDRDAPSFLFESVEPGLQASNIVSLSFLFLSYFFLICFMNLKFLRYHSLRGGIV